MEKKPTYRQHYVWRRYLRAWSSHKPDQIVTYLKSQKRIACPNLMGVAQKNSFYKMEILSLDELADIKSLIDQMPPSLQDYGNHLLSGYVLFASLSRNGGALPKEELHRIELEAFEQQHTIIETYGNALLDCKSSSDLEKFVSEHPEQFSNIYLYLCAQYLRTNKHRMALQSEAEASPRNFTLNTSTRAWPIVSLLYSVWLSASMVTSDRYQFVFLHNNTDVHFLVGDQPIINLDYCNRYKENFSLVLYYPLSPILALLVQENETGIRYIDRYIDECDVHLYNRHIYDQAEEFIFADSKSLLSLYI